MEYSKEIEKLSQRQKELRLQINNSIDTRKIIKFRKERNQVLKSIQQKQKEIRNRNVDNTIDQINQAHNDRKMYTAIKVLNRIERK